MTHIIVGDCLERLKTLPSGSVHCCITSPPFWGLRDYQTGTWEGGDSECDHRGKPMATRTNIHDRTQPQCNNKPDETVFEIYKKVCGKCGAKRIDSQLGLESSPEKYVEKMVQVFREVHRVLRDDGTLWLNLGDSYSGSGKGTAGNLGKANNERHLEHETGGIVPEGLKPKDLVGIPWRVAFALQAEGWYLRQDIIWHKPNPMPESVTDRCTKSHEYIFLLTKYKRYYFDAEAIKEPARNWGTRDRSKGKYTSGDVPISGGKHGGLTGTEWEENPDRNKRSVWTVTTKPFKGAHFAVFPTDLIKPCVLAGTSEKGCCPTCGAPWKRIVERDRYATRTGENTKTEGLPPDVIGNRDPLRHVTSTKTIGWKPTCDCVEEKPERCTVLDPFLGSGTTLVVASKEGREGIGIELNPEYAVMANKRIEKTKTLFH